MKKSLSILLMLFVFKHHCFAQDHHLIDSLQTILNTTKQDTTKANTLYSLSKAHLGNNPERGIDYAQQGLSLSEQIGFKKGIGNAYYSLGIINKGEGNYLLALEYLQKSIKIREEIKDKKGISDSYNSIGVVYLSKGNYPEALKYNLVSLKISEEIADKNGIANAFSCIGLIYNYQGNYPEALKNYLASIKLHEEIGDKNGTASALHNMGMIYADMGNYQSALDNYFKAKKINLETGNKQFLANNIAMIAAAYGDQKNYPNALNNYLEALRVFEEIGDKFGISASNISIGEVYAKQGIYKGALDYETKGLSTAKEIGSSDMMKYAYNELATIDSAMNNFKGAFENHKLYMQVNDSMFNMEKDKKLTSLQMQYDFDKKEATTKAEQEKKDAIALKELQRQKLVRNGFISGFAVVLLFAGVFFTQRNKIKKGKKLSDELLLNILPSEVAEELKAKGGAEAKQFDDVTVMFTDFKNFTQISEKLSPSELVAEIDTCFKAFDNIMSKNNIEKIKTIGDSYMCVGGLPVPNKTNATDVVNAAIEIQHFMQQHLQQRKNENKEPFEIRIGVNTGPVVAGIVGLKKFAYDIWGDTVNIASRMESSGEAGKINISGSTYELVKGKFNCTHRGKIKAKNKGEIDMYFVETVS